MDGEHCFIVPDLLCYGKCKNTISTAEIVGKRGLHSLNGFTAATKEFYGKRNDPGFSS
jgi:hypothetical protein